MPRVSQSYLDARRRQIMDAAITCFAREGFHRATMQDIVAETGLSAGAIYRYFWSKEDIVAALRNLVGVSLGRSRPAAIVGPGAGRGGLHHRGPRPDRRARPAGAPRRSGA